MNYCNSEHHPVYKIKYNPVTFDGDAGEWLVCEKCFGMQEFFGATGEIQSITSVNNNDFVSNLDRLSFMTGTLTKKLKIILLVR